MLHQAGDRVFTLARRLATAEREQARLGKEIDHLNELLVETRTSRDVLSAQVQSLLVERERDYEERAELRRLLSVVAGQVQMSMAQWTATMKAPAPAERSEALRGPAGGNGVRPAERSIRRHSRNGDGVMAWARVAKREFGRLVTK
jgi:uncharacterized coiled-coil protein SlyX